MKRSLPARAKEILADGEFCYVAVATGFGPHLTPMVYALDGGRLWLTTARSSVKARAWRRDPRVAGMVRSGDRAVAFRGSVTTYDALDPLTWPSAAIVSPRLGKAAARFAVKNARFFFGYAVDAYRVPLAWAPPARVFAAIEMTEARVLDLSEGTVQDGWGDWPRGVAAAPAFAAAELEAGGTGARAAFDAEVPTGILDELGAGGDGVLATQGGDSGSPPLAVVPARWRRTGNAFEAQLSTAFAELIGDDTKANVTAALTIDLASAWRAADMRGLMLRGPAQVFVPGRTKRGAEALRRQVGGDSLVRLTPARTVWWQGWASGTVVALKSPSVRDRRRPGRAAAAAAKDRT